MRAHRKPLRRRASAIGAIALSAAITLTACGDGGSPTATKRPTPGAQEPAFTASSGVTQTIIGTATVDPFHEESNFGGYQIFLHSQDVTTVIMRTAVVAPGGFSGWHSHPGPVLVLVKAGALTVYDASDKSCIPRVYPAGTAFFEGTKPHNVKNEGTVQAAYGVLFFTPSGVGPRIEEDFPPNCAP